MSALEKRIERLEQAYGTVKSLPSMVEFICPSRGLVGVRCGDFTMSRRDDETEVQFLLRSKRALEESMP